MHEQSCLAALRIGKSTTKQLAFASSISQRACPCYSIILNTKIIELISIFSQITSLLYKFG
jgi:hypothetical protein